MNRLTIFTIISIILSGCAEKNNPYHIYKPKVRYKPSVKALDKLNRYAIGKPYIWGEERATRGFDCSGLTYYNFGTMGIEIPRVADEQFRSGTPVSRDELQKGDLVFFATNRKKPWKATHVGIYLGNGMFEHASSAKKRVVISSLNDPYYKRHYIGARRYYNFNQCRVKAQNRDFEYYSNNTAPILDSYNNSNIFAQTQKNINNKGVTKYYIVVNSNNKYDLLTKLELSGLRANISNNKIIIGPFENKSEALETKFRNISLLANSEIRANI